MRRVLISDVLDVTECEIEHEPDHYKKWLIMWKRIGQVHALACAGQLEGY